MANRRHQDIRYLNTDLDIKSDKPFDKLVGCFRKMRMPENTYTKINNRTWLGCFEVGLQERSPEQTILKFIKVIEKLGKIEMNEWDNCRSKLFNIGFDCGKAPRPYNNFRCCLSAGLLKKIAKLGAGIEISIYPEPNALKQASVKRQ